MSEEEFMFISSKMDTIIHCGADVRHFGDVKQFENINVQGTSRMLALVEKMLHSILFLRLVSR